MLTKYPSKILYTKSEDVDIKEGLEIGELLRKSIKEDCTWGNCVGLAAPQIGINKNVFIALDVLYINPKIAYVGDETDKFSEGCYSLPDHASYKVERHLRIIMSWMNRKGELKNGSFGGFTAEVLQHEYDHLIGKLCCGENVPK